MTGPLPQLVDPQLQVTPYTDAKSHFEAMMAMFETTAHLLDDAPSSDGGHRHRHA